MSPHSTRPSAPSPSRDQASASAPTGAPAPSAPPLAEASACTREAYFEQMRQTWWTTRDYMLLKLEELRQVQPLAYQTLCDNPVLVKRLARDHVKVRPFLMRLGYEASGGSDWTSITPACAAVEFINISSYLINALHDQKGGEEVLSHADEYIIFGFVLRDLATLCLRDVRLDLDADRWHRVYAACSDIVIQGCMGQYSDICLLTADHLGDSGFTLPQAKSLYFERADKITGVFMANIAAMGSLLAGADEDSVQALYQYGLLYGCGLQLVNDLGDLIYGGEHSTDFEKAYKDLFSDLRHGKLTYPILLALEAEAENPVKRFCGQADLQDAQCEEVSRYLACSGIVSQVKSISNKKYRDCRRLLRQLPRTPARDLLSVMATTLCNNKYFGYFRRLAPPTDVPAPLSSALMVLKPAPSALASHWGTPRTWAGPSPYLPDSDPISVGVPSAAIPVPDAWRAPAPTAQSVSPPLYAEATPIGLRPDPIAPSSGPQSRPSSAPILLGPA